MPESVEHVVVEHEAEPAPDAALATAATVTVAAAESAAALAHETAAAAELHAAETVAETEEDIETWRKQTASALDAYGASLVQTQKQLDLLASQEEERHASLTSALERLSLMESLLLAEQTPEPEAEGQPASIPEASKSGTQPEGISSETLAGAETEAKLGPASVEAGASLGGSGAGETSQSSSAPGRRRRRWI